MAFYQGYYYLIIALAILFFVSIKYGQNFINIRAEKKALKIQKIIKKLFIPNSIEINYDWKLFDLKNNQHNLLKFKNKILFINFWATYCPPCLAEFPSIEKLYKKFKNRNVEFLCITLDEKIDLVKNMLEKNNYSFPVYYFNSKCPEVLKSHAIPTTYIISKHGKILVKHTGVPIGIIMKLLNL